MISKPEHYLQTFSWVGAQALALKMRICLRPWLEKHSAERLYLCTSLDSTACAEHALHDAIQWCMQCTRPIKVYEASKCMRQA